MTLCLFYQQCITKPNWYLDPLEMLDKQLLIINSRISKRRDVMDGHRSSVDRILDQVGGVRLAEPDTDSLQSSLINTEMDSMSYGRYEEESLPPELFNIIEEYPDKGRG